MKMSRLEAKMAHILIYTGAIGMVVMYLVDVRAVLDESAGRICWIMFIFCFVAAMFGTHELRKQCKCPYCNAWNKSIPSPWKANDVKYCNRCGKRLEYNDK